jgi:hypothetical protein
VARQFAARARLEAVLGNRAGDYEAARRVLEATAKRVRRYAGRDAELRGIVQALEDQTQQFARPMPALALKEAHFASANVARSRDVLGRSLRRR